MLNQEPMTGNHLQPKVRAGEPGHVLQQYTPVQT